MDIIVSSDNRRLTFLTLLMMALATVGLETGLLSANQPVALAWSYAGAMLVVALSLEWMARRWQTALARAPRTLTALLIGLFVWPLLMEFVRRQFWHTGYAPEMVLMLCLRNAGWALAVLGFRAGYLRFATLSSLCQMVFAFVLVNHPMLAAVAALYLLVASLWLVCLHGANRQGVRLPLGPITLALTLIVSVFGVALLGVGRPGSVLGGLVPGSGGNGRSDPYGQGGVNDGDGEVGAQQKAESVGFVDTNVYLESPRRSLYDALDEMYGETRPLGKVMKAIAINIKVSGELSQKMRGAKAAGKEFSLLRKSPPPRHTSASPEAKALLYITGRTPVSLKMVTYTSFDGLQWHEAPPAMGPALSNLLEAEGHDHWLRFRQTLPPIFGPTEETSVKIGLLETTHIPTPPNVDRFRIGLIDRLDFYTGSDRDTLKMDVPHIPVGTRIQLEWPVLDTRLLDAHPDAWQPPLSNNVYGRVPDMLTHDADLNALAHQWTDGLPIGWSQVHSILRHLRTEYRCDPLATLPADCTNPVHHFLFTSRRGPDYLFATSATMLLRLLGYQARVVSGFYASPLHYDSHSDHTLVSTECTHFWMEARYFLSSYDAVWLPLEPTPGYEPLRPRATLVEQLQGIATAVGNWVRHQIVLTIACLIAALLLWRFRRELSDSLLTLQWRFLTHCAPQILAPATLRLLERRFALAGQPRPPGTTPANWYPSRLQATTEPLVEAELRVLLDMVAWLAFARVQPGERTFADRWSEHETRRICQSVAQSLTLKRLSVRYEFHN